MKKVVTLLLTIVLVLGIMAPAAFAFAENDAVQPRYFRISTFDIAFDISSSGKSSCYSKIVTYESTDTIDLTIELQRDGGSGWSTIKTWTGEDTGRISLDKVWYVTSGYEYRLRITAEVYDTNGKLLETQIDYSCSVDY